MTKVGLQRSGICSLICQRKARRMSEHVRMHLERQLGLDPCTLDQLLQASNRERRTTLADEDEGRLGLTLQGPQSSQLIAQQRMRCRCSALGSAQVESTTLELHIAPLQAHSSLALRPCLNVRRIMVESRWGQRLPLVASMSFSTSRSVRCSLGLSSALGRRTGATVRFSVAGATSLSRVFVM